MRRGRGMAPWLLGDRLDAPVPILIPMEVCSSVTPWESHLNARLWCKIYFFYSKVALIVPISNIASRVV